MTVECYYDDDGLLHWPDAELDSENYYGIDWDDWLTAEGVNETKVTATWDVPTGLTNMDEETVGNVEYVKLSADAVGTYEVTCTFNTIDSGNTQSTKQKIYLTVV